jgi:hypothetical protein
MLWLLLSFLGVILGWSWVWVVNPRFIGHST